MPKQVIINMNSGYPFGECDEGDDQSVKVLVRRSLPCNIPQREDLLGRCNFFRRLNQTCIIKLEQILEEESCLHLLYEYVPIRMQTWISNINEKFIQAFCRQLVELGDYLAKCYILVDLKLTNVGMDENYRPKYFLDFDFAIDDSLDKSALKTRYQQQILSLFKPYVQTKPSTVSVYQNSQASRKDSFASCRQQQSSSILSKYKSRGKGDRSDITSVASTMILKDKAVALQKERKNQSINYCGSGQFDLIPYEKNRKQSILSSVSNVKISKIGRRIDEIKSKLRNIYSPEPLYVRHQQKNIQKNSNSIAFNYDSTQKVYASVKNPNIIDTIDSSTFCKSILRDLQHQESMFQKFEKNLTKQLCKGLPLKKNESLKAKQYEQMKKSDDGYFKDFFNVLEDKPKLMIIGDRPKLMIQQKSKLQLVESKYEVPMITSDKQVQFKQIDKPSPQDWQSRVKSAINKSKTLISKFKNDNR